MNKILIFTATYNEAENICELVKQILDNQRDADILIVDDNSPDQTYEKIKNFSVNYNNIYLKKRENKLGLNTAHIFGYDYAVKNNYEKFITMDADLSHDPREIPKIVQLLENNSFVIGSRYMVGGKNEMPYMRLCLSIFGNKFIKFIFKINCNEFTTSYRGFNINKLGDFNLKEVSSKGYSFFMETIYLISKKKFVIKQIPIYFKDREKGKSKIPRIEMLRTLLNIFKLKLNIKI